MREVTITKNEGGQRLDKYLKKYFTLAPTSFIYKMLRKKNITVNEKKATPEQMIAMGDVVKFYLAEETIEKFRGSMEDQVAPLIASYQSAYQKYKSKIEIVYEDKEVLILSKPAGILSQKASESDLSCNEFAIGYLLSQKRMTADELSTYKPSISNRLDRNTSGLLLVGISLKGSQVLARMIQERSVKKYYVCMVTGVIKDSSYMEGYLSKNEKTNQVKITKEPHDVNGVAASLIQTAYQPLESSKKATLLEVELITGKTHQIRAHLSSIGHSIIGDTKYRNGNESDVIAKQLGIKYQLLHAYKLAFPMDCELETLAGKIITLEIPDEFRNVMKV